MKLRGRAWAIRKRAKRGHRGYPVATVALYGRNNDVACKVAVGIVVAEGEDAEPLKRWLVDDGDVRADKTIEREILEFIREHGAHTVVLSGGIIGCPHEEGIDYPEGASCPECPYWAGRDRFTKEQLH